MSELAYKRTNVYEKADEKLLKEIFEYAEGYKTFLDEGKTEREVCSYVVEEAKKAGYRVLCAGIRNSVSLYEADLKKPILLIVGGEKRGISASLLALADEIVRIDYGRAFRGSLSTASATAVMAFEILHRNQS